LTSSIYPLTFTADTPTITANNNIFSTPITILSSHVSPGGGGIVRLYFSFTMSGDSTISVRDGAGTVLKGNLNADNSSLVSSNGYYRFDIDVESGDTINLRSTQDITVINTLRAHLVQFGA